MDTCTNVNNRIKIRVISLYDKCWNAFCRILNLLCVSLSVLGHISRSIARPLCDSRATCYHRRWPTATKLKTVFGNNSAADRLMSVKFCTVKQTSTVTEVTYVCLYFFSFFVFLLSPVVNTRTYIIANRSRVSCAHNTSRAFIGLITPWPWNLG